MRAGLRSLSFLQSTRGWRRPPGLFLFARTMSQRTYKEAVDCLNSLQSNAAALEASRQLGASRLVEYAIPEMIESLERIGYKVCGVSLPAWDDYSHKA